MVYIYRTPYRMTGRGPRIASDIPEELLSSEDVSIPGSLAKLIETISEWNKPILKDANTEPLSDEVFYLKTIRNQVINTQN